MRYTLEFEEKLHAVQASFSLARVVVLCGNGTDRRSRQSDLTTCLAAEALQYELVDFRVVPLAVARRLGGR
jgi:hypothetical protein